MQTKKLLALVCAVVLVVTLTGVCLSAGTDEELRGTIKERFKQANVKILTGELWQQMSADTKVAFLWGAGQIINLENELMEIIPELKRDSFVVKAKEGLSGIPMNDIVSTVDNYYKTHPDKLDMAVIGVIWDTMIKPKIKTGIAGRPLQ